MWILLESISVDTPEKKIIEMENSIILNHLAPPMVIFKKKNLEDISADWMFAGYLKPPVSGV